PAPWSDAVRRRTPRPLRAGASGKIRGRRVRRARSERRDVRRLGALGTLRHVELDLLVLLERAVAARVDRGEVREDVSAALVGGDDAEALLGVEPLDGSGSHGDLLQELEGTALGFGGREHPCVSTAPQKESHRQVRRKARACNYDKLMNGPHPTGTTPAKRDPSPARRRDTPRQRATWP